MFLLFLCDILEIVSVSLQPAYLLKGSPCLLYTPSNGSQRLTSVDLPQTINNKIDYRDGPALQIWNAPEGVPCLFIATFPRRVTQSLARLLRVVAQKVTEIPAGTSYYVPPLPYMGRSLQVCQLPRAWHGT